MTVCPFTPIDAEFDTFISLATRRIKSAKCGSSEQPGSCYSIEVQVLIASRRQRNRGVAFGTIILLCWDSLAILETFEVRHDPESLFSVFEHDALFLQPGDAATHCADYYQHGDNTSTPTIIINAHWCLC